MTLIIKVCVLVAVVVTGFATPLWVFALCVCGAVLVIPVPVVLGTALIIDAYMFSAGALSVPWHVMIVAGAALVTVTVRGRLRIV